MTEDKLKEITTNLRSLLCCGSDLPENDCVFDEIYAAIEEAYNLGKDRINDLDGGVNKNIIHPLKLTWTKDEMIVECDIGNNMTKKVNVKPYSQAWYFFLEKPDCKRVEVCFEKIDEYQDWIFLCI